MYNSFTFKTRSTGTVHTSTKAHLTSVAIRIQIRDPDCHQYLIICSLAHCQHSLKFHANPFTNFCANLLTDRQTNNHDLHILLGRGNQLNMSTTKQKTRSMIICYSIHTATHLQRTQ